jgi:hypothetical protein
MCTYYTAVDIIGVKGTTNRIKSSNFTLLKNKPPESG